MAGTEVLLFLFAAALCVTASCAVGDDPAADPGEPVPALRTIGIEVVGDGRKDCVLGVEEHSRGAAVPEGNNGCLRAADAAEWHSLRASFGGAVAALPDDHISFGAEQAIVVSLTASQQLQGVTVSSEEGVDVVMLDVDAVDDANAARQAIAERGVGTAVLLRVDPVAPQLMIVLRDRAGREISSLAIFTDR